MKKIFALLLAVAMLCSLAACGTAGEKDNGGGKPAPESATGTAAPPAETEAAPTQAEKEPAEQPDSNTLVVGKDIDVEGTGQGPVTIVSRFGSIFIPAGIDFVLDNVPAQSGGTDIAIVFGEGGELGGRIIVSNSRFVSSLDEAVAEGLRMNSFSDDGDHTVGGEVTYVDVTYKNVRTFERDGGLECYLLVACHKPAGGEDLYVEVTVNGPDDAFAPMAIDDPAIVEMLKASKLK